MFNLNEIDYLKQEVNASGITHRVLAEKLAISPSYLSLLLGGRRKMDTDVLFSILEICKIPILKLQETRTIQVQDHLVVDTIMDLNKSKSQIVSIRREKPGTVAITCTVPRAHSKWK